MAAMQHIVAARDKYFLIHFSLSFIAPEVPVKAVEDCGESNLWLRLIAVSRLVKVASQRLKQSKTAVNRLRLVNRSSAAPFNVPRL
jgi:hypothetical protein